MQVVSDRSQNNNWHPGTIEVLFGCMFSGKTETLIRRIESLLMDGYRVAIFCPQVDTLSQRGHLHSHSGLVLEAIPVANSVELLQHVRNDDQFVSIDEAQFFDERIVDTCLDLARSGKHLLIAGLDLDFRGAPFGPMPRLIACASILHKLNAQCSVCGQPAYFSQRLIDGRPAAYYEEVVLPGGSELYQPRCHKHHEVPGRRLDMMRTTEQTLEWRLLDWISRLRSVGKTGLNLSEQTYDRERYGEILAIAAEMGLHLGKAMLSTVDGWQQDAMTSQPEEGYITPKTAVAVAAFDKNGCILLVKRSDTEGWAVPGGWADVGLTPSENAANEAFEETGLKVRCDGLVGVYDTRLHQIGRWKEPAYTLLFHGNVVDGELRLHRHEVLDAGLFGPDSLPHLYAGAARQVHDALRFHTAPSQSRFD